VGTGKTAVLWVALVGAGIAVGLWVASMSYPCGICVVELPRFATWQCCLVGFAVSAMGFVAIGALDHAFVSTSFGGTRRAARFLFEDLAQRQPN
jgi:hypothetical protein